MRTVYLVICYDEEEYAYTDRKQAIDMLQYEGDTIWECDPGMGVMRDITHECAIDWFDGVADIYDGTPEWAEPFVGEKVQDRREAWEERGPRSNAHSTYYRGIGL